MNDMSVPISRAVAYGTWVVAALGLLAAWAVSLWASQWVGNLLATTSACLFAIGAVAQVRWYLVRMSKLIRLASSREAETSSREESSRPHAV